MSAFTNNFNTRFPERRGWVFAFGILLGVAVAALGLVHSTSAQNYGLENLYGNVNLGNRPLLETIGQIINVALGFLGVIAVGLILYAGFLWMTARGNEERIGKAKRILTGGVIGLAIIFAAYSVAAFVIKELSEATTPSGDIICWDGSVVTPPATCPSPLDGLNRFEVRSVLPARNATGVPLCKFVQGKFNKILNSATINGATVRLRDTKNTSDLSDDTAVTGTFSVNEDSFAMDPTSEFERDRRYDATIISGASGVKSATNAQLATDYSWYFTTGNLSDTTLPAVTTVYPSNGSSQACRSGAIQVIFSEEMDITTFKAENVVLRAGAVIVPARVVSGSSFNTMTLYPTSPLPANSLITVTLKSGPPGGITDSCGNHLDGDGDNIPSDYTWSFTTGDTTECTPHIDAISPANGYYGETIVDIQGNNLGITGDVLFNDFVVDGTNNTFPPPPPQPSNLVCWGAAPSQCNTGAIETIRVRVPVGAPIPPSPASVVVDMLDGHVSNAVSFDLQSPYIRAVAPNSGPVGQFVTVKGAQFGASGGRVRFRNTTTGAYEDAELACGVGSWGEGQIVVKVPVGLSIGYYEVQVETAAGKRSNLPSFTVNNDPLGPGLCSLSPSCSQNGVNPIITDLTGVRFGATVGTSRVLMSNQVASAVTWTGDQQLRNAQWMATFQDASHAVQVEVAGRRSNSLDFDIPCTGAPRVVESELCSTGTQSPSPWKGSTDACSNAAVSARFTAAMNTTTFTHSVPGANIEVSRCTNSACTAFVGGPLIFATLQLIPGYGGSAGFTLTDPATPFVGGDWYQGTIKQVVTSIGGQPLRSDYVWTWQVDAAVCPIDKVMVADNPTHIRELDPLPNSTANFTASAQADNCNVLDLDPAVNTWSWLFSNNGTPAWVAKESESVNTAVAKALSYMPNRLLPAYFTATVTQAAPLTSVSGRADVYVDALACRTSQDCVAPGCSAGVSRCVSGLCTPIVNSFTPPDGALGTWVSINGCFFGTAKGQVFYQLNQEGGWPDAPTCSINPWTNRVIVSKVPPLAADGTIEVRRPDAQSATSSASFDVNTTNRPKLCRRDPSSVVLSQLGTVNAKLTLQGKDFGDPMGAGDSVQYYDAAGNPSTRFGSAEFTACAAGPNNCSWSEISTIVNTPVGTPLGADSVAVVRNGASSNQLPYQVWATPPGGSTLPPTVSAVNPPDGIARVGVTSIVTVAGTNLVGGRVIFVDSIGRETPAPVTGCMAQPTGITVELPPLANGIYRVAVRTNAGISTEPVTFTVNDVIRPGVCSINPSSGRGGTLITVTGRNFTDNRKPPAVPGSFVSVACDPADAVPGCNAVLPLGSGAPAGAEVNRFKLFDAPHLKSWSTSRIVVAAPEKVRTGNLFVSVNYSAGDTRASNPLLFSGDPYINSITPERAPEGTWVTIRGGNFGVCDSRSGVWAPGAGCAVSFSGPGGTRLVEAVLPTQCRAWSDNEIVAKVPPGVSNDGDKLVRVSSQAALVTAPERSKPFTVDNTLPLPPGLCMLTPDTIDSTITHVTLEGDRFGSDMTAVTGVVKWPSATPPVINPAQWQDQLIIVDVPTGTTTGAVAVERKVTVVTGRSCNGVQVGENCIGFGWTDITEDRTVVSNPKLLTYVGTGPTTAAPQIVLPYVPADGASDVCRNTAIQVSFDNVISLEQVALDDFQVTHAGTCTASAPSRRSWIQRLLGRVLPGADAAAPIGCRVQGNLRTSVSWADLSGGVCPSGTTWQDRNGDRAMQNGECASGTLSFVPTTPLIGGRTLTVAITSPNVLSATGLACSSAGTPCKFSFTTRADLCVIDRVEINPEQATITVDGIPGSKAYTARALTADGALLNADYYWTADDPQGVIDLSDATGVTTRAISNGRNGTARLRATADISALDPADGKRNPAGTTPACPSGYRWYDYDADNTLEASECVKNGYIATGAAGVDVFLCELPWTLEDPDYNFRLRYCRAKVITPAGDDLITNSSFEAASTPSLSGWNEFGGAGNWQPSAPPDTGDGDNSAALGNRVWDRRLYQAVGGLKPNTSYIVRAKVFVDPLINYIVYGGLAESTSANCSSIVTNDQRARAPGWQEMKVFFNTGASTSRTICLFVGAQTSSIGTGGVFSPAIRFDNITVHEAGADYAPLVVSGPTAGPGDPEIVREYFLKHPGNPDAVALRIYKNDARLAPKAWYDSRPDIIKGSPLATKVDGYDAMRDGGTSYIAALNSDLAPLVPSGTGIFSNIYVLGMNRGATGETSQIYQQLLDGWLFNTNQLNLKNEMQRDLVRLNNRAATIKVLDTYAAGHGQTVPTLVSGSYLKNRSVSRWDSWQDTLGRDLGATLTKDPLNNFNLPTTGVCEAPGFDQDTCWNNSTKVYQCPAGSHVYNYESLSSTKVKLAMNMEAKGVTWCSTDAATCNGTGGDVVVTGDDACESSSVTIDVGSPPLVVQRAGAGAGTVSSDDTFINCGTACAHSYSGGATVVLSAAAPAGSVFTGWTGDCTGTGTCTVIMTSNRTVRATFAPIATLQVSTPTGGQVVGPGISCPGDCAEILPHGTTVTLNALATGSNVLQSWGGACAFAGSGSTCTITLDGDRSVSASFAAGARMTVTTPTNGIVTSSPARINCGTSCDEYFAVGSTVLLTAIPDPGYVFTGWGGGTCSGLNTTCTYTASGAATATATFAVGKTITIAKAGTGGGTVTSNPAGVTCGADCAHSFAVGPSVTFTAAPNAGSTFTSWSGGSCVVSGLSCTIASVSSDTTVTATFTSDTNTLTVTKGGTGTGTVTSNPAGINCGTDCNEVFTAVTSANLIATADAGSIFTGWTGDCSGASPSCTLTMGVDRNVTATFATSASAASITVSKSGTGSGTVTSTSPLGVNCGGVCSASFTVGTSVTLSATPAAGSVLTSWGGCDTPSGSTCTLNLGTSRTVTVTFSPTITLGINKTGSGTITSNPSGISCGAACTSTFASGSPITLTEVPFGTSVFTGWSGGGCAGTNSTCTIAPTVNTTVSATFAAGNTLTVTKSGSGAATSSVSSNPAGINCGADCTENYLATASVVLTATAGPGYMFTGWGGYCSGTSPTCTVPMSAARSVSAAFTNAYLLSVTKNGTGAGTVVAPSLIDTSEINCGSTCSHLYAGGATVLLTAVPSSGSTIASWSIVSCGTAATCSVTVSAATNVTVTFNLIQYTVSVGITGAAGSGTVASSGGGIACPGDCTQLYNKDTGIVLTATPAAGYMVSGWSGDCVSTGSACTLTVDANKNTTVTFTPARSVTLSILGGGVGSVRFNPGGAVCSTGGACPAVNYAQGSTVVLTATAQAGSVFQSWAGDCAVFTTSPTCTLSLSVNKVVQATFAVAPSYSLTVTTSGTGSVTSSPGGISCGTTCSASYFQGTDVILTAAAGSGYVFSSWGGNCSGTSPSCTVSMDAAKTVSANFTALPTSRTVTVSMTGLGAITSAPAGILCGSACSASYADGTSVTLTATALPGYIFQDWGGDCTGTNPTCALGALSANKTVVANFVVGASYTVRVTKAGTGDGTVTSNPAGINCGVSCIASYASGSGVTLTAVPVSGSTFVGWTGDCTGTGACSLTMNADKNVTATFDIAPNPVLSVTIVGSGSVTGSGINCPGTCSATYTSGSSVTLTASPAAGNTFSGWSGMAGCTTATTCAFTISANASITATFVTIGPPVVSTLSATNSPMVMVTKRVATPDSSVSTPLVYAAMSKIGSPIRLSASVPVGPGPTPTYTRYLNGSVNPKGLATTAWFRWGTANAASCDLLPTATAVKSLGSGGVAVTMSQALTGLSGLTTYYYCAVGQNSMGTTYGSIRSFKPTEIIDL